MIRTRDFLLYSLVLLFLLMGIAVTVSKDTGEGTGIAVVDYVLTGINEHPSVRETEYKVDRALNIASLRQKIADGEGRIAQGEPVFTSVDTQMEGESAVLSATSSVITNRVAQYCAKQDLYSHTRNTLSSNHATMHTIEGARVVQVTFATGSSSTSTAKQQTILQMPMMPHKDTYAHCLDSSVVGVTNDGQLILNDQTWRFRQLPPRTHIGYARDGFPIYSQGTDESLLDACGGYDAGSGYAYHLREKELFVLGCFAASPAVFLE